MANTYLDFISDEHLLKCIENLHKSYVLCNLKNQPYK